MFFIKKSSKTIAMLIMIMITNNDKVNKRRKLQQCNKICGVESRNKNEKNEKEKKDTKLQCRLEERKFEWNLK